MAWLWFRLDALHATVPAIQISAIWNEFGGSRTSDAAICQAWPKNDLLIHSLKQRLVQDNFHLDSIDLKIYRIQTLDKTVMTSLYQKTHYRRRPGIILLSPAFIFPERAKTMRIMKTPDGPAIAIAPIVAFPKALSVRLTIRSDEAARRKIADTDGTLRRERRLAESNRLI